MEPPSKFPGNLKWTNISKRKCSSVASSKLGKKDNLTLTTKQICAGNSANSNKDACQLDSGGPMACMSNGVVELVGIVSYGIGCGGTDNIPGVYTRVASYLNWIKPKMVTIPLDIKLTNKGTHFFLTASIYWQFHM